MSTWIAHLRIADAVLAARPRLAAREYVMGSIAPDSGVPTADWRDYDPPRKLSHFEGENTRAIQPQIFYERYLREERRAALSPEALAFYLGYYHHLLTDVWWHEDVVYPARDAASPEEREDMHALIWKWKQDWYDLDFLYLEEHSRLPAWELYRETRDFPNEYLDFFPAHALAERQKYIVEFYSQPRDGVHREYPYLGPEAMDAFVARSAERLLALEL